MIENPLFQLNVRFIVKNQQTGITGAYRLPTVQDQIDLFPQEGFLVVHTDWGNW